MAVRLLSLPKAAGKRLERHQSQCNVALLSTTREIEPPNRPVCFDADAVTDRAARGAGRDVEAEHPLKQRRKADLDPRNDRHLGRAGPGLRPVPPQGKPFDPGSGCNPHGKKSGQLSPCRRERPQRSAEAHGASASYPVPNAHGIGFTLHRATFGPLVQELETARRSGACGLLASHANHVTSCFR